MRRILAAFFAAFLSGGASAGGLPDKGSIYLVDRNGAETAIGSVSFSQGASGETRGLTVTLDGAGFKEYFLSMRPFRCITSTAEWFCHLPYPYKLKNVVSDSDLTDLEYQLLFLRKTSAEFGIDAWNGLYYALALQPDGTIAGDLLEGDFNGLAGPPAEEFARPLNRAEFIASGETKRLFPHLVIR